VDDPPFRLQSSTGIEQPTFLKSFSDPGLPLLLNPLHLFGRHRFARVLVIAIDEEEFGHVLLLSRSSRPHSAALHYRHDMTNQLIERGQKSEFVFRIRAQSGGTRRRQRTFLSDSLGSCGFPGTAVPGPTEKEPNELLVRTGTETIQPTESASVDAGSG